MWGRLTIQGNLYNISMKYSRYLLLFTCFFGGVCVNGTVIAPVEPARQTTQNTVQNTTPVMTRKASAGYHPGTFAG